MRSQTNETYSLIGGVSKITSLKRRLLRSFKSSKEYRHGFIEEKVRASLAAQIKAIREQRGLTPLECAELLGKKESWVLRLEDPDEVPPSISTLLSVARAFDVDLNVSFASFGELLEGLDNRPPKPLEVPSFEDEAESLEARIEGAHKRETGVVVLKQRAAAASTSEGLPNLRKGPERASHNREKERFVIVR
jgi:transcriptional regulator with XRE-family HTH domain